MFSRVYHTQYGGPAEIFPAKPISQGDIFDIFIYSDRKPYYVSPFAIRFTEIPSILVDIYKK